MSERIVGKR